MTETNTSELRMMQGTTTGYTYIAFARIGQVALGVKPNSIIDGSVMGVPGKTFIGARIRSAPWDTVSDAETDEQKEIESNVVQLGTKDKGLAETWPNITFDKSPRGSGRTNRASARIGVFLRGTFDTDPHLLKDQIADKKLANKMADYLIELAGGEQNLIISQRQLRDWLDKIFIGYSDQIEKALNAKKAADAAGVEFNEYVEQNVGNFGNQAAILKSIHDKHNPNLGEADMDASDALAEANDIAQELGAGGIEFEGGDDGETGDGSDD